MIAELIEEVERQLPDGEKFDRMYRACEGDLRVISKDRDGNEYRYTISADADGKVIIKPMKI